MTITADEFFGRDLKVYNTKMTEIIIQQTKEDIAILQEKLEKLEELQRTKSPVGEAYKKVYGWYPPTTSSVSNFEDMRWTAFQDGYDAAFFEGCKIEEPKELKTLYQMWNDGECRDDICYLVKIWMSQYADNVLRGECKKGYEYCLTILEENLK